MRLNYIDHCDCLEGMKSVPDESVDLILCDLPYGTSACKWDERQMIAYQTGRRSILNPETKLQNQIIVALCQNGCVARNHTVGQFYTKYGSLVNVGRHGESDIMGHRIRDGRAIYIEVKLPGEYPRPDQKQFLEAMRRTGALAGCAHSVEEALKIVTAM